MQNNQLTMFSEDWRKNARTSDPETSKAAARSLRTATQRAAIISVLQASEHPLAVEQIADRLPGQPMIWRRMSDLERDGLVLKTDELHTNRTGRKAVRYIVA